jgi:hypothetical protein
VSVTAGSGVEVVAIDTAALGDRSYLAHDGTAVLVVDPQRETDRALGRTAARGVRLALTSDDADGYHRVQCPAAGPTRAALAAAGVRIIKPPVRAP